MRVARWKSIILIPAIVAIGMVAFASEETIEQQLDLAQAQGKVLTPEQLSEVLSADTKPSRYVPIITSNENLLILALATSLGVVAFQHDQQIMDVIQNHKSTTTESISSVGNFLGSGAVIPLAAGTYYLGLYYNNNKLQKAGLFTVGSVLATGAVTMAVKTIVGRARPYQGNGPNSFLNFGDQSFFSGHTAVAFSMATVFSEIFKNDYPVVPWVAYGLATVTAYARVHDQQHWASDVIVGAAAGHLVTKLFLNELGEDYEIKNSFTLIPTYDSNSKLKGLHIEYRKQMQ
jgi:membrane-associated phospholipid phosphatase